ncbi:MAG: host attachment protein [Guyparkeria sp.]|uniref:host attachment protein n=1 Tax=Guyparkeria sp. TaxID=2035736 RepID=UPI003977EC4C
MNTWVLVADAARARFLIARDNPDAYLGSQAFPSSQPAPKGALEEMETLSNHAARLSDQDLETDRPGATTDRKGDAMHAYEPPNSVRDVEARRFAREIVKRLDNLRNEGKLDRFYLLSAPDFLGVLRDEMDKGLREIVVAEKARDLSMQTPQDIRSALPERL